MHSRFSNACFGVRCRRARGGGKHDAKIRFRRFERWFLKNRVSAPQGDFESPNFIETDPVEMGNFKAALCPDPIQRGLRRVPRGRRVRKTLRNSIGLLVDYKIFIPRNLLDGPRARAGSLQAQLPIQI